MKVLQASYLIFYGGLDTSYSDYRSLLLKHPSVVRKARGSLTIVRHMVIYYHDLP